MNADAPQNELLQAVEALRNDVQRLADRVAALERQPLHSSPRTASASSKNRGFGAPVTDEALISVISAAVAAYLGVQPRIRQIRLIGGGTWAQQGRVTLQASHVFSIRHG